MAKVSNAIAKTKRYFKRNGLKKTISAAMERLTAKQYKDYCYEPVSGEEQIRQRNMEWKEFPKISILVPVYETKEEFLRDMIESVLSQTYSNWELVIADASDSENAYNVILEYVQKDEAKGRILCLRLKENRGISRNTNEALKEATGEYIALLDHDDVITSDALFHVAKQIVDQHPLLIYSDEDKTDETLSSFYDVNRKKKLNLDLIMSNNYICHLCVIRADIMKQLQFRFEYDGAQDYDLILRCISCARRKEEIVHIPLVLYHWRCHSQSTAANTDSKMYAYENGRLAVEDFARNLGMHVSVEHTDHLGFYKVNYIPDLFSNRPEIGIVAGPVYRGGKIIGGAMKRNGEVIYQGLPKNYSGYMHRAHLQQMVSAADVRNMEIRPELKKLWEETVVPEISNKNCDYVKVSLSFCEKARMRGYFIVYSYSVNAAK